MTPAEIAAKLTGAQRPWRFMVLHGPNGRYVRRIPLDDAVERVTREAIARSRKRVAGAVRGHLMKEGGSE